MQRIGFVGLGAMGLPMACRLLGAGHAVRGFDLAAARLEALREAGGEAATSAADAARGAELLVLMVVNAEQASCVLFEQGALEAMAPRGIVCLMATCPPQAIEALAARVEAAQKRFVDAPVSGGVRGATEGTLTIFAAASPATFADAEAALRHMGSRTVHLGPNPGQGAMAKTVNQLLCGVHIAAAAEALALAGRLGIEPGPLLELLGGSAAGSWMLRDRGPRMLDDEPPVASAIDIFVKDLGIVLEAARGAKAATPLAALAHQLFQAASARGEGRADDSQVIRSYRALTGG